MAPPRACILRLESRPLAILAIDAAGFLLGAAVLVAARFVPQLVSPLAFWLLLGALAAGFGADLLRWQKRGIRAIELDGETLVLSRGRARSVQRIERAIVLSVATHRRWGGRSIEIHCRGPGRCARTLLRDDAFDRAAFAELARRLAAWEG